VFALVEMYRADVTSAAPCFNHIIATKMGIDLCAFTDVSTWSI